MTQKLLQYTQNESAAKAEIERLGGRIVHQFSPTAFVAELPEGIDPAGLAASTAQPTQPLDSGTQLAVTAWSAGRAKAVHAAPLPTEGLPWDSPGFDPPREYATPTDAVAVASETDEVSESTGTPTSRYMIGSVAVGLVLVSRDTGSEVLTAPEQTKIVQEVQEGLDWLATVEPRARVSFVYDIRPVTVTSAPGPYAGVTDPYERFERDWRDAALATLGYAAGQPGYRQYANDLRATRHTDWAYVAFFTKYPLNHFAYAVVEKVVMNYANDGWGPDNINRVFAHESCHIFGAADEYGACVCGAVSGHLNVPNNNCVNCFPPGAQQLCLMNANTLQLCDFSRRQIGWDPQLFPPSVPPPREQIDGNVTSFRPVDSDTAFVLGADKNLWREQVTGAVPPPRVQVDGNVAAFQALDHDAVFVLGTDGNLWREQVTGAVPPPRVQVDGNVAAFQALDHDTVFVLGADGNLWREHVAG